MNGVLRLPALLLGIGVLSCGAGEGEGSVTSDRLYVKNCWNGAFDLRPTFFATTPFGNTQQIRIQRGERNVEVSDGVLLVLGDVARIRSEIGQPIRIGLPADVNPPGFPPRVEVDPPDVGLTLYLYDTCHIQNGALHAVDGEVTFSSLFSGDRNENDSGERFTSADFTATVTDPRDAELVAEGDTTRVEYPPETTSQVHGHFEFFFERGIPAQPFP
jgi:hypothetical protein